MTDRIDKVAGEEAQPEVHAERDDHDAAHRGESPPQHPHRAILVERLRELERNDVVQAVIAIWRYGAKNRATGRTESREDDPPR